MNDSLAIRAARDEDAPAMTELCGQLGYPSTVENIRHRAQRAAQDSFRQIFVAELSGSVIGWIEVSVRHFLVDEGDGEITGLIVDSSGRSRGVGAALLRKAEQWALEKGCRNIRVRCNMKRADAHRFYAREGYAEIKRQIVFRRELA